MVWGYINAHMPDSIVHYSPRFAETPKTRSPFSEGGVAEAFLSFMHQNGFPTLTLAPEGAMKPLEGGTCSANWRIATPEGTFVMSIAEKPIQRMSPKDVRHFENYLFRHEVSLAEPIGPIGTMPGGECFFQVNRFVKGIPFDDLPGRTLNQNQLGLLGIELAKTHIWGERFHRKYPYELLPVSPSDRMNFIRENRAQDQDRSKGLHLLHGTIAAVSHNCMRSVKALARKSRGANCPLPKGIIHGDFNHTNVLFDDDTPRIIDWSNAHYDAFVDEIAKALVEFIILPEAQKNGAANHADVIERIHCFLLNYNMERPLTKEERVALPDALGAMAVSTGFRPIFGQGDRYAKGNLPQGALLQDAVHSLCTDPAFNKMLATLSYNRPKNSYRDTWLGGGR